MDKVSCKSVGDRSGALHNRTERNEQHGDQPIRRNHESGKSNCSQSLNQRKGRAHSQSIGQKSADSFAHDAANQQQDGAASGQPDRQTFRQNQERGEYQNARLDLLLDIGVIETDYDDFWFAGHLDKTPEIVVIGFNDTDVEQ